MEAGKGQASETRRRNTICLGAVLDLEDNRIAWRDISALWPVRCRACSVAPRRLRGTTMNYITAAWIVRKTTAEHPAIRRVSRRNVRGTSG